MAINSLRSAAPLFVVLFSLASLLAPSASFRATKDGSFQRDDGVLTEGGGAGAGGAFGVSAILSQAMLDSILRREAPSILEGIGFEHVTIDPAAELNVVDAALKNVTFGVNISISKVTVSVMKDMRLDVTVVLDGENIVIRHLRLTPPEHVEPKNNDWHNHWLNFQQSAWEMLMSVGTHAATSLGNQFMDYEGLKSFNRNLCLSMPDDLGSYDARVVAWKADSAGDIGVGLMLRPQGSEASLEKPEKFPLPYPKIAQNGWMDNEKPASMRSRVAIFFEDGLLAKMTNSVIALAFHTWVRSVGKTALSQAIASSSVGGLIQAQLINDILGFFDVADNPNMKDINIRLYREGEGDLLADFGWGNQGLSIVGTTAVLDFSNDGHGLLDSIFTGAERRVLLGQKQEPTEEDKKEKVSMLRFGLCPARHWLDGKPLEPEA